MSILRIVCGPADIGPTGYTWETEDTRLFDPERVEGAFSMAHDQGLNVPNIESSGDTTWYHWRFSHEDATYVLIDGYFATISDSNSNALCRFGWSDAMVWVEAVGDTTDRTGSVPLAANSPYSFDVQVVVGATITVRWYINGGLYGEKTVNNSGGKGNARSINWTNTNAHNTVHASEIVIADEDTRGLRVREMRPKAFGIYQEWDGSIISLRDTDLATGISTDTNNRRVSFGITNIEHVQPGDVVNRVVMQTYAQKGETGLSRFNHFFRHKNGNVSDGAAFDLDVLGDYYIEEFAENPDTEAPWVPADFGSLQTGVRSLT